MTIQSIRIPLRTYCQRLLVLLPSICCVHACDYAAKDKNTSSTRSPTAFVTQTDGTNTNADQTKDTETQTSDKLVLQTRSGTDSDPRISDEKEEEEEEEEIKPDRQVAGQRYFDQTMLPLFNTNCANCHADPRMNPPLRGPLTIFSYDNMRNLLMSGTSEADNALSRKVRNVDPHGGGNQCQAGPTMTPCREISEWWTIENGSTASLDGKVTSISDTGEVLGYAVDTRDTSKSVTVQLKVDGQPTVETVAALDAPDGNYPGAHAFKVLLPANVRDGKEHTIQAYVGDIAVGSELKFVAYAPKDAGRNYFTMTVSPALTNACSGCHVVRYEVQYSELLSPTPAKGGTAASNNLINYASGSNGHPGGNVCGSKSSSPCSLLQAWWNLEFGP